MREPSAGQSCAPSWTIRGVLCGAGRDRRSSGLCSNRRGSPARRRVCRAPASEGPSGGRSASAKSAVAFEEGTRPAPGAPRRRRPDAHPRSSATGLSCAWPPKTSSAVVGASCGQMFRHLRCGRPRGMSRSAHARREVRKIHGACGESRRPSRVVGGSGARDRDFSPRFPHAARLVFPAAQRLPDRLATRRSAADLLLVLHLPVDVRRVASWRRSGTRRP